MTAKHGGSRRSSHRNSRGHRTGPGRGRGGNNSNVRNNPTNTTLSEAMERYGASEIGELQWKMKLNPAEYMSVSDLIDDTKEKEAEAAAAAAAEEAEEAAATQTANEEAVANTPSYLTSDDLTAWWDGIDKSSWTKQEDSKPKPMDDFMKMMMFMSVLNPRQSGNLSQLGSMFGQFN